MATKVTHFENVSGKTAIYVGAKGSEIKIADATSAVYRGAAGSEFAIKDKDALITYIAGSVSIGSAYVVAPYSASVAGYHVCGGVAPAVPGACTVYVGSAGAELLTAAIASATAEGAVTSLANTSGTTTIAAGGSIKVGLAASGTAFVQSVVLVLTRAGA